MKIAHFSDTHGLPRKGVPDECNVIVHTGDLFPNKTRGDRDIEPKYQEEWLRKTIQDWARWCGDRPFVYMPGNHDFFDGAVAVMRRAGIKAFDAREGLSIDAHVFAGIPDIPWMGNEWNHERHEAEIAERFAKVLEQKPDIIVCHCPIYGVLDSPFMPASFYGNGGRDRHIGSSAIATALTYSDHVPKAYLHGHCHEQGGKEASLRGMIVSNAATTRRVVEIGKGPQPEG